MAHLCAVLALLDINYLQVDQFDSESLGLLSSIAGCAPKLVVNPVTCDKQRYHENTPSLGQHQPLLVARTVKKRYLQFLDGVCYTSVHVWCWLRQWENTTIESVPKICDGYILADRVEIGSEIELYSSSLVQAFVSRMTFEFCGRHGIGSTKAGFEILSSGMKIPYVIEDTASHTGPLMRPQNSPNMHLSRKVQGFERSLMLELGSRLNLTFVSLIPYGDGPYDHFHRPKNVTNILDDEIWDRTTLSYILTKQAVLVYGDLSVSDPRDRYIDFTIVHDVDANAFMSRIAPRKLSTVKLVGAGGKALTSLYFVSAIIISTLMAADIRLNNRKCRRTPSFRDICFYNAMLLFQQSHPLLAVPSISLQMDCVWRIAVFSIGAVFSAGIVTFLASAEVDGKVDTFMEIGQLLLENKEARIFYSMDIDQFEEIPESVIGAKGKRAMTTRAVHCLETMCLDMMLERKLSIFYHEGLVLRRQAWERGIEAQMHIVQERTSNCYQAMALSKGCFLKHSFNKVIRRLLEGGVMQHFKSRAGVQDFDGRETALPNNTITIEDVEGLFIIISILLGICILVLLLENLVEYSQRRKSSIVNTAAIWPRQANRGYIRTKTTVIVVRNKFGHRRDVLRLEFVP